LFTVTSKQFLRFFSVGLAAIAAVVIPFNMRVDLYGLFRPGQGRSLSIYGEERIAKYLHSYRYIPENFDGVLFGSSVSAIFGTRDFSGYRIYNASIQGGNAADLEPIAENIFRKGNLKLTIVCVHRYLTNDHLSKTDLISPKQYWGALGSPQLMTAYISRLAIRTGISRGRYDEYGVLQFDSPVDGDTARRNIDKAVAGIQRGTERIGNYTIDPIALAQLQELISVARNHSQQLVVFYPPIPAPILAVRSEEFARYRDTINGLTKPCDIVVDFNSPEYEWMRTDYRNFIDGVHLSPAGATALMSELVKIVGRPDGVKRASLRP
jgi:hypothetical protein